MLHHREQLDVRIPHIADVGGEPVRDLAVIQVVFPVRRARAVLRAPGSEMDLIDVHRRGIEVRDLRLEAALLRADRRRALRQPLRVLPDMAGDVPHDGGGLFERFRLERIRVSLHADLTVLSGHGKFIELSLERFRALDTEFPDSLFADAFKIPAFVPAGEIGDERDPAGIRRPGAERIDKTPLPRLSVAPEVVVSSIIRSLMKKICREFVLPHGLRGFGFIHGRLPSFPCTHYTGWKKILQGFFTVFTKFIF